jgi:hypothetical protein
MLVGCANPPPPSAENCTPLYKLDGTVVRPCGKDTAPALPDDAQRSSAGALDKVYKEDRPH